MKVEELAIIKDRADIAVSNGGVIARNQLPNVKELITQDIPKLVTEVERLRKALEYYAEDGNYEEDVHFNGLGDTIYWKSPIEDDAGYIAKEALK